MNKLYLLCLISFLNCTSPEKPADAKMVPTNLNKSNSEDSFLTQNYLSIYKLYIAEEAEFDSISNATIFYRLVDVRQEETISLYVEKIRAGTEGGNLEMVSRKKLTPADLGLEEPMITRIDSLIFISSNKVSLWMNGTSKELDLTKL